MDFNITFKTSDAPQDPRVQLESYKVRFMDWETSVRSDATNVIYYFRAWTRRGSIKRADKFVKEGIR
jgi:hypothetical protein